LLFQQTRVTSLFDEQINRIHDIVQGLLTHKDAFHRKTHYSSSDDAYRYRV
jgi:hypothetical protein